MKSWLSRLRWSSSPSTVLAKCICFALSDRGLPLLSDALQSA